MASDMVSSWKDGPKKKKCPKSDTDKHFGADCSDFFSMPLLAGLQTKQDQTRLCLS